MDYFVLIKANNNYGIYPWVGASFDHILSLICYCDLTNFSREWSSTFRFIKFGESIQQLKHRNSRFYHCSKHMIEVVNVFGISGPSMLDPNRNGHETGPFYCGLNYPLLFPSYVTRFCGPCSTSKQLSVATRFADSKGVIISLTNKYNEYLQLFDCSWLSNFKEEDERVFISGLQRIKIENITVVKGGKHYKKLVNVLTAFDEVINGVYETDIDHSSIGKQDIKYLQELFEFLINSGKSENNDIMDDQYLQSLLYSYQQHKTQIVINLDYLKKSNVKNDLLDMITEDGLEKYHIDDYDDEPDDTECFNLVKLQYLVSVFKPLDKIIIYTTSNSGFATYNFDDLIFYKDIIAGLDEELFKKETLKEIQVRATRYKKDEESWICDGLYLSMKQRMKLDNVGDDELTISLSCDKSGYSDPRSGDKYEDIFCIKIV